MSSASLHEELIHDKHRTIDVYTQLKTRSGLMFFKQIDGVQSETMWIIVNK
jgi:hypothetical protein